MSNIYESVVKFQDTTPTRFPPGDGGWLRLSLPDERRGGGVGRVTQKTLAGVFRATHSQFTVSGYPPVKLTKNICYRILHFCLDGQPAC